MISVVIPVRNSQRELERCLAALSESCYNDYECLVVDDASSDRSAEIAKHHGCRLIQSGSRIGPAAARNLGAQQAHGEILFFIDADVCVRRDSLQFVAQHFAEDEALDAVIGSYDDSPEAPDFLSQYRNLMHHFVHQSSLEAASTFWSGCGAIRREVFLQHSGFSEDYRRPAIEDIELGYRLIASGHQILLDKNLQVKHLKAWTFWRLIKTDIFDRGIPWTELILRDSNMPKDLNLQIAQRISVALVFLMLLTVTAVAVHFGAFFFVPLLLLVLLLLSLYWFHDWNAARPRTGLVSAIGIAFGTAIYLAWRHHMLSLIPPLWITLAWLYLRHRFLRASRHWRIYSVLTALCLLGTIGFILSFMPNHPVIILPFVLLMVVLFINVQFYGFLRARKNFLFALAAIPFHLVYHFYNGLSFCAGLVLFWIHPEARRLTIPSVKHTGAPNAPGMQSGGTR